MIQEIILCILFQIPFSSFSTAFKNDGNHSSLDSWGFDISTNWVHLESSRRKGSLKCECGEHEMVKRTVDGFEILSGEFPWLIGFVYKNNYDEKTMKPFCYGALINDRYILTAASCLRRKNAFEIAVVLLGSKVPIRRKRSIDKILIHEEYDQINHSNDIALVRLTKSLDMESLYPLVLPICLPVTKINENVLLTLRAMMIKSQNYQSLFPSSHTYYFGCLPVHVARLGHIECTNIFTKRPKSNICWDDKRRNCYGEHGSMLTVQIHPKKYGAVGIYSKGYGCKGWDNDPPADVSTDISRYVDWISEHTSDAKFCIQ